MDSIAQRTAGDLAHGRRYRDAPDYLRRKWPEEDHDRSARPRDHVRVRRPQPAGDDDGAEAGRPAGLSCHPVPIRRGGKQAEGDLPRSEDATLGKLRCLWPAGAVLRRIRAADRSNLPVGADEKARYGHDLSATRRWRAAIDEFRLRRPGAADPNQVPGHQHRSEHVSIRTAENLQDAARPDENCRSVRRPGTGDTPRLV